MKKTISIALIIALVGVVLCFAACGGGGEVDDLSTSQQGEMTSMMDEATTLMDELEEDLSDAMGGEDETTSDDATSEATTSDGETTGQAETTGEETSAAQ